MNDISDGDSLIDDGCYNKSEADVKVNFCLPFLQSVQVTKLSSTTFPRVSSDTFAAMLELLYWGSLMIDNGGVWGEVVVSCLCRKILSDIRAVISGAEGGGCSGGRYEP